MINSHPIDGDDVVALEVRGRLTHEDYRAFIIPRLESAIEAHGRVRCLAILGEDYEGITPAAVWDDLKFDVRHRGDFERVAVVTDDALVRAAVWLTRPLFSGDVRLFSNDESERAVQWIQKDGRGEQARAGAREI